MAWVNILVEATLPQQWMAPHLPALKNITTLDRISVKTTNRYRTHLAKDTRALWHLTLECWWLMIILTSSNSKIVFSHISSPFVILSKKKLFPPYSDKVLIKGQNGFGSWSAGMSLCIISDDDIHRKQKIAFLSLINLVGSHLALIRIQMTRSSDGKLKNFTLQTICISSIVNAQYIIQKHISEQRQSQPTGCRAQSDLYRGVDYYTR